MATMTVTSDSTHLYQELSLPKVQGCFNYYNGGPLEENDVSMFEGRNHHIQQVTLPVQDIRSDPSALSLQHHGVQLLTHQSNLIPSQSHKFGDENFLKTQYWPELRAFIKNEFKARAVFVRDSTFRDASLASNAKVNPSNPRASKMALKPFFIVHGDYTPAGGRSHIRAVLPTYFEDTNLLDSTTAEERDTFMALRTEVLEAEDVAMKEAGASSIYDWDGSNYEGPRYGMFSIWRPLATVRRDPLAVMNARTLEFNQITELPRIYANRPGFVPKYKVNNVLPYPPATDGQHAWYWISEQTPEEVWALKLFDSDGCTARGKDEGVAKFAAHSAFGLDNTENEEQRKSCEIRVIVIW